MHCTCFCIDATSRARVHVRRYIIDLTLHLKAGSYAELDSGLKELLKARTRKVSGFFSSYRASYREAMQKAEWTGQRIQVAIQVDVPRIVSQRRSRQYCIPAVGPRTRRAISRWQMAKKPRSISSASEVELLDA